MDKFCPVSIKKFVVHVATHYITSQEAPLMSTPLLCFKQEMEKLFVNFHKIHTILRLLHLSVVIIHLRGFTTEQCVF